jgi:hypothetical protein
MVNAAPRERILNWIDDMPEDPAILARPRPSITSVDNPGLYPDPHCVEYPDDMDLAIGRDVEAAESNSVFDEFRGVRTKEAKNYPLHEQLLRICPWGETDETVHKQMEQQQAPATLLRSHMA